MRKLVRQRGIIVDIHGRLGVALTRDGDFRHVRLNGPVSLGDEVRLPAPVPVSRVAQVAAMLVLMFMAGWWLQWVQLGPVVAYVSVDINPSIELGVDARWRVVEATGLNPVGAVLLTEVTYRGRHVREVVADLAGRAVSSVPESTERVVLVTVTSAVEKALPPGLLHSVTEAVHQKVTPDVTVQAVEAGPEVRDEGQKLGISTGRMAVALEAHSRGVTVEIEALKEEPLGQAAAEHGLKLKDLVQDMAAQRDWPGLVRQFRPAHPLGKEPVPPDDRKPGNGQGNEPPGQPGDKGQEPPGQPGDKGQEPPGPPGVVPRSTGPAIEPPGIQLPGQPGPVQPPRNPGNPNPGPPFRQADPEDLGDDGKEKTGPVIQIPLWTRGNPMQPGRGN